MKTLKNKNEDILFESLEKIFNLDGGDIDRDDIYEYIFYRVILEMLLRQDYNFDMIIGQFKKSFIDVLKIQKENIDDEIKVIKDLNFKESNNG
jgi:hypothetical protein|tara:strand:+ start:474 stop:752 length:279 start_codon:yes stop_codon:yes gene_type:complete